MRTLTALAVAAALSLGVTGAYASQSEGGFSIGVKGGYNDMSVPTNSYTTTGGNTITAKKDKYVADIHVAYLWPVADVFQLGGQLGYSYYGKYKLTGSNNGSADAKFSDPNLQLVGQWNIQQWFIALRAGMGYFKPSTSNSFNDFNYDTKSTWDPLAGASAGYFFTDNFSGEVFVDHVFGKNYSNVSDVNTDSNKPPTMTSAGIGITYSF